MIRTVQYSDDLVLLVQEETVLQEMTNSLIEVRRKYGMKMNGGEGTNIMKISRQRSRKQIVIDQNNRKMWNISTTLLS